MSKRIIKNFILYVSSFLISMYLHKGTIYFGGEYDKYLFVFIISWGLSGLLSRKFKVRRKLPLLDRLYTYTISFFLMVGTLAISLYLFNLIEVSRAIILYSLLIAYLVEVCYLVYTNKDKVKLEYIKLNYNGLAFSLEVSLFSIVNLYLIFYCHGNISVNTENLVFFISLYLSWFAGSFIGHHFSLNHVKDNYWAFIWKYIKSYTVILALSAFSAFITRLEPDRLKYVFYGVLSYSLISFTGASLYFYIKRYRRLVLNLAGFPIKGEFGDVLLDEEIKDIRNNYKSAFNNNDTEFLQEKLRNLSLKRYPQVYEFVDKCIDLGTFDNSYSLIIKSDSILNVEFLPDNSLQLLINLQRINQIHNINEYFTEINKILMTSGIFIGNFETDYLRHQWFLKNYPYHFAQLFYFFDFLWNRVFSKLILCRSIYKKIMGGTNKALSLAEGLGRLYYCGFEILHLRIINNSMYFIARKNNIPISDISPSTGILFKMKRYGKDGKPVFVYKLRTMHPYAQFLQGFVYEKFNLQGGGKLNNDFRISYWGKILRKLWLDELPMIYNWLNGDLKLIGCRPLSKQYFNLYTEELKQKRMRFKPGLIPPFYADNPKCFDEIMNSEKRYLELYEKNPVKTDIIYFIKCVNNILFKGARSC